MKEYIKYVDDDYIEFLTLPKEASQPNGYKPLLPLYISENVEQQEAFSFIKLIIQEDAIYFQLLNTIESSNGNIRIIPFDKFRVYVNAGDDIKTPSETIQNSIKELLTAIQDPTIEAQMLKAKNLFLNNGKHIL